MRGFLLIRCMDKGVIECFKLGIKIWYVCCVAATGNEGLRGYTNPITKKRIRLLDVEGLWGRKCGHLVICNFPVAIQYALWKFYLLAGRESVEANRGQVCGWECRK